MSNTGPDQDPGNRVIVHLMSGALLPSSFVAMLAFILWTATRDIENVFWSSAALTSVMLLLSVVRMVGGKWRQERVAVFLTAAGTAMGIGFAGMSLFQETWWGMGAFGTLFVAFLVALFTDMDDHVKLWGLIVALFAPAGIVAGTFMYILDAAGIG